MRWMFVYGSNRSTVLCWGWDSHAVVTMVCYDRGE